MNKEKQTILVTWDFTVLSEYALEHAVRIANVVDNNITLLHILKDKKDAEEAQKKLTIVAKEAFKKFNIKPGIITKEGSIFFTISQVATQIEANLVIMGTHGMKGMQKFTGSWALKVIVGSKVPFIVVQEPPKSLNFHDIVYPINFKSENKEPMNWVIYLGKYYRSKIHFFKENIKDSNLKRKANNNIIYAKKILDAKGIDYDVSTAVGKKSFANETIDYASQINSGLILIMTTKSIGFTDYVFSAEEQNIIANSHKIPVMCINPREDLKKIVWY